MTELESYIKSGILERFVLGELSAAEAEEVKQMIGKYPRLQQEIDSIRDALEGYALAHSVKPPTSVKHTLMESLAQVPQDGKKKQMGGDPPMAATDLPELSDTSTLHFWKKVTEKILPPEDITGMHAKLIGQNRQSRTFVVWSSEGVPEEVHTDIIERFFILEGSCDCVIGGEITHMKPGDFMEIPLHKPHHITVTSPYPMKVILQKSAA